MTAVVIELFAEILNGDHAYSVTVEAAQHGVARLIVKCENGKTGQSACQGVDLKRAECRALGQHLLAVAEKLEE